MLKLRCLAVGKHSRFFVGDICEVTKLHTDDNMKTGIITAVGVEAKFTERFKFSEAKNLITKTEAFRLMLVPVIAK